MGFLWKNPVFFNIRQNNILKQHQATYNICFMSWSAYFAHYVVWCLVKKMISLFFGPTGGILCNNRACQNNNGGSFLNSLLKTLENGSGILENQSGI